MKKKTERIYKKTYSILGVVVTTILFSTFGLVTLQQFGTVSAASEIKKPSAYTDPPTIRTTNAGNAYDTGTAGESSTSAATAYGNTKATSIVFHSWPGAGSTYTGLSLNLRYSAQGGGNDTYSYQYSTTGATTCSDYATRTWTTLVPTTSATKAITTVTAALSPSQNLDQLCLRIVTTSFEDNDEYILSTFDIWTDGTYVPATDTPTTTSSSSQTTLPTSTATSTNTPNYTSTATATPSKTPNVGNCTYIDTFTTPSLDSGWSWIRENPLTWSLTQRLGSMRIYTEKGDIWENTNNAKNILVRNAPIDNFEIRARLFFSPTKNYQQAGLLIYENDDNYAQIVRAYINGQQVGAVDEESGSGSDFILKNTLNEIYLRLVRTGSTITAYYSADGSSWSTITSFTSTISNLSVGIITDTYDISGVPQTPADFDFFCIEEYSTPTSTTTFTPSDTPTFTSTPTDTFTPSDTPTNTFTPSDTPTFTNTPTDTYTPSDTPTNTFTPSDTPTFTSTPTDTYTPSDTPTNTFTPSDTPTNTFTPSDTPTFTSTPTETYTPSDTPTNTFTPSDTPTFTSTPTDTFTPSDTPTNTFTPSDTPTFTSTPTETYTPSDTPTNTFTPSDTPTNTFTPSDTPTFTSTPTDTYTPSDTPTNTFTSSDTPTFTSTPTDTFTPSDTPTNTFTPSDTPTFTSTPTDTYTPSDTPTNTFTSSDTPTFTSTPTDTFTPSDTPTNTFTPSDTPTETYTPSDTPTDTYTPSDTPTNTFTPSDTPTFTSTPTDTFTPSDTPTNTFTPSDTPTFTSTPTETYTPSDTPTNTFTPSDTPTDTYTPSDTPTNTFTPSDTPSDTPTFTSTPTNTFTSSNTPVFTNIPTETYTPSSTETNTPTRTETATIASTSTDTVTPINTNTTTSTPLAVNCTALDQVTISQASTPVNGSIVLPGDLITYSITIKNNNAFTLTNIDVYDTIGLGMTYFPGSIHLNTNAQTDMSDSDYGKFTTLSHEVFVRIPILPASETAIVSFSTTINDFDGVVYFALNTAGLTLGDLNCLPLRDSNEISLGIDPYEFTKQGIDLNGAPLLIGDTIEWVINVKNVGKVSALNVLITDMLPSYLDYVTGSITGIHADDTVDQQVTWNIGTMSVDQVELLTFRTLVVSMPVNGIIYNQATLANDTETIVSDNPCTVDARDESSPCLIEPTKTPTKTASGGGGGSHHYTATPRPFSTSFATINPTVVNTLYPSNVPTLNPSILPTRVPSTVQQSVTPIATNAPTRLATTVQITSAEQNTTHDGRGFGSTAENIHGQSWNNSAPSTTPSINILPNTGNNLGQNCTMTSSPAFTIDLVNPNLLFATFVNVFLCLVFSLKIIPLKRRKLLGIAHILGQTAITLDMLLYSIIDGQYPIWAITALIVLISGLCIAIASAQLLQDFSEKYETETETVQHTLRSETPHEQITPEPYKIAAFSSYHQVQDSKPRKSVKKKTVRNKPTPKKNVDPRRDLDSPNTHPVPTKQKSPRVKRSAK